MYINSFSSWALTEAGKTWRTLSILLWLKSSDLETLTFKNSDLHRIWGRWGASDIILVFTNLRSCSLGHLYRIFAKKKLFPSCLRIIIQQICSRKISNFSFSCLPCLCFHFCSSKLIICQLLMPLNFFVHTKYFLRLFRKLRRIYYKYSSKEAATWVNTVAM